MMYHSNRLIFDKQIWISILLTIINSLIPYVSSENSWNTKDFQKREHCLIKPYHHAGASGVPLWDFGGTAMITSNHVRLTADKQSSQGYIWNSVPVNMHAWELHLHFKVAGKSQKLFGDGIAFWYTKERMVPGSVFGNKDFFCGLGIFLDTYSNHNGPHNHIHPYVSAMVSNGSLHYDHDMDGTHTSVAAKYGQVVNRNFVIKIMTHSFLFAMKTTN